MAERRHSYRRSREAYGSRAPSALSLAERRRSYGRYAPRGRGWFGSEVNGGRYSNPEGAAGAPGKLTRFGNQVLKPAGWGALGLIGSRVIGEGISWVTGKVGLTADKLPVSVQPFAPIALALASAGTTWALVGSRRVGGRLTPEKARYINVGAGLLVVQEVLALILPKLGFLPVWAKRSLTGELPPALAGLPAVQAQQAALGNCFTGSCASALAPYGWMSPPCSLPQDQVPAWSAAQMIASQGRPLQGQDNGMGNCFTGACPGNAPGCTGNGPQCCGCPPQYPPPGAPPPFNTAPYPPAFLPSSTPTVLPPPPPTAPVGPTPQPPVQGWGMAGSYAVQRSGIADPVIQQILAGSCERAQKLFDQVGLQN